MENHFADDDRDIKALRERYRSIAAPPYLARRIQAHLPTTRRVARGWRYAAACLLLMAGLIWVLPTDDPGQGALLDALPQTPSLANISGATSVKPPLAMPGLSSIKTYQRPVLPSISEIRKFEKS